MLVHCCSFDQIHGQPLFSSFCYSFFLWLIRSRCPLLFACFSVVVAMARCVAAVARGMRYEMAAVSLFVRETNRRGDRQVFRSVVSNHGTRTHVLFVRTPLRSTYSGSGSYVRISCRPFPP